MEKYKLEIFQEEWADSPRYWDNLTTMVCFHNRYDLGDMHNYNQKDYSSWGELREAIENDHEVLAIEPLFLYDHSGLSLKTHKHGYHGDWDCGQVGWVFITEERRKYIGAPLDSLERQLLDEVEIYDKYLSGEVYGFRLYERKEVYPDGKEVDCAEWEEVDSCWGFYDKEDIACYLPDDVPEELIEKAWSNR